MTEITDKKLLELLDNYRKKRLLKNELKFDPTVPLAQRISHLSEKSKANLANPNPTPVQEIALAIIKELGADNGGWCHKMYISQYMGGLRGSHVSYILTNLKYKLLVTNDGVGNWRLLEKEN